MRKRVASCLFIFSALSLLVLLAQMTDGLSRGYQPNGLTAVTVIALCGSFAVAFPLWFLDRS